MLYVEVEFEVLVDKIHSVKLVVWLGCVVASESWCIYIECICILFCFKFEMWHMNNLGVDTEKKFTSNFFGA